LKLKTIQYRSDAALIALSQNLFYMLNRQDYDRLILLTAHTASQPVTITITITTSDLKLALIVGAALVQGLRSADLSALLARVFTVTLR